VFHVIFERNPGSGWQDLSDFVNVDVMQMMLLMVFFDFWVLPFLQLDLESSHCLHWPNNPLFEDHEQIISPGCTDWCDWRPLEGRVDDQQIVERIGLLGGTTI